jgi:syntaxin 6
MSRDPYNEVKRYVLQCIAILTTSDVETNLSHTKDLWQSYSRISSAGQYITDIEETRNELRSTLEALEADLEDLDESVRAVEGAGSRWGMDDNEISRRRGFVERVKSEVKVCAR